MDDHDPTRADLLTRVATGDPEALDLVIGRYGRLVWSIARKLTRTLDDAEDVVQEVWIALWKDAGTYDPAAGAEANFVATVARRRGIDRLRRQRRRIAPQGMGDVDPAGDEVDPLVAVALADDAGRARAAMPSLRPEQRMVLELALEDGSTHHEIAEQLAIPLGTVKTHARRGLIRLREMLGETDDQG